MNDGVDTLIAEHKSLTEMVEHHGRRIVELRETIDKLQDELTEAYNQLAEKHDDIREERDRLKLAVNRIHKHLEGIAEYQCSDDMWSIFLAIDEEVEDVLDETT